MGRQAKLRKQRRQANHPETEYASENESTPKPSQREKKGSFFSAIGETFARLNPFSKP
ncbi:hypothetical protein IQ249_08165 [Lusitaniella coriacea LEGE 07157]|uniref:Uncharacterized protein n=1 Tax=Lusitaniella coriacea LEGE 07157 TaxID=945747 RepID=A0A8J7J1L7_9CYAN|nr:hypothetical protein [Lusitaniella coriacea]MBE9115864.1 hypothetical protein [Lusitaniella coriacea LEGE 07157]